MPIYEYEPDDRDCLICDGKLALLQDAGDEPARYCPHCGLGIVRVVSRPAFRLASSTSPERAAQMGFTTYRKLESGVYERVAGDEPPP